MMTPASSQRPSDASPAARPSWKRRLRRGLITLGIVLVVLAGVAYMLPTWACTEQGRIYALQQINRRLNGSLNASSWRLGWFSPTRLDGVTLSDPKGQRVLSCASIQTDLTLWQWLWGRYDLGSTIITAPRFDLQRYPDGSNDLSRILAGPPGSPKKRDSLQAWLSSLRGAIQIGRGDLILRGSAGQAIHLADSVAEITIASSTTTVHVSIRGTSVGPDGSGVVSLDGNLPGLALWTTQPVGLLRDVEFSAHALPTPVLAEWLGLSKPWPRSLYSVPAATVASWLGLAPQWEQAVGPVVEEFTFVNHPRPDKTPSLATVHLKSLHAQIDQTLVVEEAAGRLTFSVPQGPDARSHIRAGLGRPISDLLCYVNPIFQQAAGSVELTLTEGALSLPISLSPDRSGALPAPTLSAAGVLTFVDLQLQTGGLLHDAWALHAASSQPALVRVTIPRTRVDIADGRIRTAALAITASGYPRTVFSGSVGFDGTVQLLMSISTTDPGILGSNTLQLPIRGTVSNPIIDRRSALR